MRRRYTIHKDGDILMEELDDGGLPTEPEPVPQADRLPFSVILGAPDGELARSRLVELIEAVLNLESGGGEWTPKGAGGGKLPIA